MSVLVEGERKTAWADGRIAVHVELGGRRDVARPGHRPAHDDDPTDQRRQFGIADERPGDVRQRPQGDDRHRVGSVADLIADHLLRGQQVLPLGHHEAGPAQPVAAVEVAAIDRQAVVGLGGGPQPRPARRIELLDDRLHVPRGLGRRDVAADGRHGHDVQLGVRQRQAQRHRVVDARIDVEDHLPGHCILVSCLGVGGYGTACDCTAGWGELQERRFGHRVKS